MSVTITKCPFQPGIMITASDKFWGRMSERLTLISRLQNMGSTAINGSRRIGKSSLAYFVYNYCKLHFQDVEAIWIDCQYNKLTTLDGFFKEIQKNSSLSYTSGKSKDECLSNFIDSIRSSSKKTAIFIDEFELLTDVSHEQQFDKNFYLQLRMLGQEGKLAMVLVSKEPLREICKHVLGVSSPFYNIFNSVPLLVFSEDDVRNFLSAEHDGFKFSKKEIKFIKSIEGYRHPLILQIASEALFINRQSKENEEVLKKKIYDQINNYLNHEEVQLSSRSK